MSTTTDGPLLTTLSSSPLPSNQRIVIGSVTCILGNLLISISLNIQKHAHNKIAGTEKSYIKSPIWWCGIVLMAIGEFCNFAAYGFAPTGLIATLGSSGVIFNGIIAVLFLKEKPRIRDIVGMLCAVGGAWLLVYYAQVREGVVSASDVYYYLRQVSFIIFFIVEAIVFTVMVYLRHYKDLHHVVIICMQVALLGSVTVISAKAVSSLLETTISGISQMAHPIFYVMLVLLVASTLGQIRFLNQAMSLYDASVVIPINFVLFSVAAIMSGITFYQEFWNRTSLEVGMTMVGALLSFGGVYLLSGGRETQTDDDDDDEDKALLNTDEHPTNSEDHEELHDISTESPFQADEVTQ